MSGPSLFDTFLRHAPRLKDDDGGGGGHGALWARGDGFPESSNPSDVFVRGQSAGMIVCAATVTLLFTLRFFVKYTMRMKMLLDDWTCIIAWVSIMLYTGTVFVMIHYGLGKHMPEVSPEDYSQIVKWLYASSIVYIPATYVTKVTLLLLVARVFAVMERAVKGIHFFIVALGLAYLPIQIVKIFSCTPISAYWDPTISGSCLDLRKIFVSDMTLAVLTDMTILILPIPLTWSLSFSWQKKLKIALLLGAGGAATAVTAYRMYLVIDFIHSTDPTYEFCWLALLTLLEMSIGLACSCLPALNVLLERTRRKVKGDGPQYNRPRTTSSMLPADRPALRKLWTTMTERTLGSSVGGGGHFSRRGGGGGGGMTNARTLTSRNYPTANTNNDDDNTLAHTRTVIRSTTNTIQNSVNSISTNTNANTPAGGGSSQHRDDTDSREVIIDTEDTMHTTRPQPRPLQKAHTTTNTTTIKTTTNDFYRNMTLDLDVESQMSTGRPVILTPDDLNHDQMPMTPECLRMIDSALGRREGWLASADATAANILSAAAAREAAAAAAAAAGGRGGGGSNGKGNGNGNGNSGSGSQSSGVGAASVCGSAAMVWNVERCRSLRDHEAGVGGGAGSGFPFPDRIWDGT